MLIEERTIGNCVPDHSFFMILFFTDRVQTIANPRRIRENHMVAVNPSISCCLETDRKSSDAVMLNITANSTHPNAEAR